MTAVGAAKGTRVDRSNCCTSLSSFKAIVMVRLSTFSQLPRAISKSLVDQLTVENDQKNFGATLSLFVGGFGFQHCALPPVLRLFPLLVCISSSQAPFIAENYQKSDGYALREYRRHLYLTWVKRKPPHLEGFDNSIGADVEIRRLREIRNVANRTLINAKDTLTWGNVPGNSSPVLGYAWLSIRAMTSNAA